MGQLAFLRMFLLVAIPTDINDNRRHIHVFRKGGRLMCKMDDVKVGIKKLDFGNYRGKMAVYLTDGREVIVPLSMFPDIKNLSLKKRKEWMVLDDQYFTFEHLPNVYSVKDVMQLA